jgi:hypothetical protein
LSAELIKLRDDLAAQELEYQEFHLPFR